MTKVFLREKKLKHSKRSLYLDFYPPIIHAETLKPTRREHLGLYIFERPKTEAEKNHNKETKILADNIRANRQIELQAGNYGFILARNKQKDFIAHFRQYVETKKKDSKSNYESWLSVLKHLVAFAGETYRFDGVTEKFCADFKDFLLNQKLATNSAATYFDKFKTGIRIAFDGGLLPDNPAKRIKSIKLEDGQREFLTLEELQILANTPFKYDDLRRASLFSALTGLRYSDIEKLTWGEIQQSKEQGYYIRFRQQKTGQTETLPISQEAFDLLGARGETGAQVFQNLKYSQCVHLPVWTLKAGIDKEITFHCFRHTHATLQLTLGTDLYTVSKMLGHKSIKTTQVYAKIIDQKKREAANKITLK